LRRFHEAKLADAPEVVIWGTGTPKREFLYVDDMAAASVFVMNLPHETYQSQVQPQLSHINVGYGSDVTISELAQTVAAVVGYCGHITFDSSKPDGAPRKLMDSQRINKLGWWPLVNLQKGLCMTYEDMNQTF
jgi:GDP-L-fucose synthase